MVTNMRKAYRLSEYEQSNANTRLKILKDNSNIEKPITNKKTNFLY